MIVELVGVQGERDVNLMKSQKWARKMKADWLMNRKLNEKIRWKSS